MDHEPTLTRDGKWGPVRLVCDCGWAADETLKDGAPMTQAAAWLAYAVHNRTPLDFSGDRGIRARVV